MPVVSALFMKKVERDSSLDQDRVELDVVVFLARRVGIRTFFYGPVFTFLFVYAL